MEGLEPLKNEIQEKILQQLVVQIEMNSGNIGFYIVNQSDLDELRVGEFVLDRIFIGVAEIKPSKIFLFKHIFSSNSYKVTVGDDSKITGYAIVATKEIYLIDSTSVDLQSHSICKIKILPKTDVFQNKGIAKAIGGEQLKDEYITKNKR